MNIKTKIVMGIILTFVLGVAIGALLNRALVQKRIKDLFNMRAAGIIFPGQEKFLGPTSPEQDKLIKDIFDKHSRRLSDIHHRYRNEIQTEFKMLWEELEPVLTPEQKKRLGSRLPIPPPPPHGRPPGFRPKFRGPFIDIELSTLKESLALSEEQAKKIKKILEEFRDQEESMFIKRMPPPEGALAFRKIQEDKEKAIENVLTNAQKVLYKKLLNDRENKIENEMRERDELEKSDFPDAYEPSFLIGPWLSFEE